MCVCVRVRANLSDNTFYLILTLGTHNLDLAPLGLSVTNWLSLQNMYNKY